MRFILGGIFMKQLKAAVIGVGGISNEHINGYIKNPNVELYAFCDINEKQLKFMSEKYGVIWEFTTKQNCGKRIVELLT